MTRTTHKQHPSDSGAVIIPSKKLRPATSPVCQSQRTSKGTGGATEQLKKFGEAVTLPSQQKKLDQFMAAGEAQNLMAPEIPGPRMKRVSILPSTPRTLSPMM